MACARDVISLCFFYSPRIFQSSSHASQTPLDPLLFIHVIPIWISRRDLHNNFQCADEAQMSGLRNRGTWIFTRTSCSLSGRHDRGLVLVYGTHTTHQTPQGDSVRVYMSILLTSSIHFERRFAEVDTVWSCGNCDGRRSCRSKLTYTLAHYSYLHSVVISDTLITWLVH